MEEKEVVIKPAVIGTDEDCKAVANKCKNCPLKDHCDFDWIYKLASAEADLLGFWNTADMKVSMRTERVLVGKAGDQNIGFVHFRPCTRGGDEAHTTMYHMAAYKEARGHHISRRFMEYLMATYHKPLQLVCIKDSFSDKFWAHNAVLVGEKTSKKGTPLTIYHYWEDRFKDETEGVLIENVEGPTAAEYLQQQKELAAKDERLKKFDIKGETKMPKVEDTNMAKEQLW